MTTEVDEMEVVVGDGVTGLQNSDLQECSMSKRRKRQSQRDNQSLTVSKRSRNVRVLLAERMSQIYANCSETEFSQTLAQGSCSYHNVMMVMGSKQQCSVKTTISGDSDRCMQNRNFVEVKHIFNETESKRKIILIEGDSGSGKSTLAMHIAKEVSSKKIFLEFSLVILVHLRDFVTRNAQCVADIVPVKGDHSIAKEIAGTIYMNQGEKVLFILDGWNELPMHLQRDSIFHELIDPELSGTDRLSKSTVIVTSRYGSSGDLYPVVSSHVELLGFKQNTVKELLHKRRCKSKDNDRVFKRLQNSPIMDSKYCAPLNVDILLHLVKDGDSSLPDTYTQLVLKFVACKFCEAHHTGEHIRDKSLSLRLKDQISPSAWQSLLHLCKLAYEGIKEEKLTFSALPPNCKCIGLLQVVESLVESKSVVSYRFLHNSVQESLTAFYIATQLDIRITDFFDKIGFDDVFHFFASITKLQAQEISDIAMTITEKYLKVTPPTAEGKSSLLSFICSLYEAQNVSMYEAILSHIEELDLSEMTLTSSHLLCIGTLLSYASKSSSQTGEFNVNMQGCNIDDQGCKYLANGISSCLRVQTLVTKRLCINLASNDIREQGVKHLSSLLKYRCIETLDLSCNCVFDEGAKQIANQLEKNISLRRLQLNFCGITASGSRHISNSLKENNHLERLDLSFNALSDDDIHHIAGDLQVNKSLQRLNLNGCPLTKSGFKCITHLIESRHCPTEVDINVNFKREKLHPNTEDNNPSLIELCERWNSCIDQQAKSTRDRSKNQPASTNTQDVVMLTEEPASTSHTPSLPQPEEVVYIETEFPTLSSKPKLHHIDLIEGNGKTVRIIQQSASKWKRVAIRLEFESYDVERLSKDYHLQCRDACQAMFGEWLNGKGRKPITWETVIKALKEAALSKIATNLEKIFSTSKR